MRLSDIVAELKSLRDTVAGLLSDKTKATAEVLTQFSEKLTALDGAVNGDLAQANSDLTTARATIQKLGEDMAGVNAKLSAAEANVTALIGEKTELAGKLTKAEKESATCRESLSAIEEKLSSAVLAANCPLKAEDGSDLPAAATDEHRAEAASRLPAVARVELLQGAVNAAIARVGVPLSSVPAPAANADKQPLRGIAAVRAAFAKQISK